MGILVGAFAIYLFVQGQWIGGLVVLFVAGFLGDGTTLQPRQAYYSSFLDAETIISSNSFPGTRDILLKLRSRTS